MRILIADSGPLIVLARIQRLDLLACAADLIVVPQAVAAECTRDLALPGARHLSLALQEPPFAIEVPEVSAVLFPESLGPGERAAISLAGERTAPLLMDDLVARSFAVKQGLMTLGVPACSCWQNRKRPFRGFAPCSRASASRSISCRPRCGQRLSGERASSGAAAGSYLAAAARASSAARRGGWPKRRVYSRLNWEGLA